MPEKPYGQRSLAGYSSKGCKERDTIKHAGRSLKQLSTHAALDHLNSLGVVSLSLNWDNNGHVFSKREEGRKRKGTGRKRRTRDGERETGRGEGKREIETDIFWF